MAPYSRNNKRDNATHVCNNQGGAEVTSVQAMHALQPEPNSAPHVLKNLNNWLEVPGLKSPLENFKTLQKTRGERSSI